MLFKMLKKNHKIAFAGRRRGREIVEPLGVFGDMRLCCHKFSLHEQFHTFHAHINEKLYSPPPFLLAVYYTIKCKMYHIAEHKTGGKQHIVITK
jgi:hypothetical protein